MSKITDKIAMIKPLFTQIIDADLNTLVRMDIEQSLEAYPLEFFYAQILRFYLENNWPELERISEFLSSEDVNFSSKEKEFLLTMSAARREIRHHQITKNTYAKLIDLLGHHAEWDGEICFVLGLAYEVDGNFTEMRNFFRRAHELLKMQGAHKKAVKALLNHVVAISHIDPSRRLINDYVFLYQEARKLKARSVAAIALTNLSREYELLGDTEKAYKVNEKALRILSCQPNSRSYALTLVHKAYLLLALDRASELNEFINKLNDFPYPEVRAAVEALREKFPDAKLPKKKIQRAG